MARLPVPFGEEVIEQARARLIGHNGSPDPADGVATGWAGGEHVLDLTLDAAKNIVDDGLHLSIRIDTDKIPAALLRAYTQIEIDALAQLNPSGIATKGQRQDAKEAAKRRAEAEAADGRFRRLNHVPVLWDGRTNILYAGSTSTNVLDRLQALFRETFDRTLEPITSGSLADSLASRTGTPNRTPAGKLDAQAARPGERIGRPESVFAWSDDSPSAMDYLGNEFMVWIWHTLQNDGDTIELGDGSEVTVMLTKTLTLDCPRGETGRDQLTDDAPDPPARGLPCSSGGQAAAQGGNGPGPSGCPVRADLASRVARGFGCGVAQSRGSAVVAARGADRPAREPPPPDRDARPALRGLSHPANFVRLDR